MQYIQEATYSILLQMYNVRMLVKCNTKILQNDIEIVNKLKHRFQHKKVLVSILHSLAQSTHVLVVMTSLWSVVSSACLVVFVVQSHSEMTDSSH